MHAPTAVSSNGMLSDDLDLHTAHLGHLPLVRALITQLGIDEVLDELLPKDPRNRVSDAQCVAAMILNVLSGRCALYSMPQFFEHVDSAVILGSDCPPDALNDARLAAALDHLFDVGTDTVMSAVARRYLERDPSKAYSAYLDTTSLSVHGAYDVIPAEGAPTLRRGFSKDHRPDLKQLIFGLSLHGAAGIPLTSTSLDGNTSDKQANEWTIEALAGLLPEEDDVTLVGDSKLVDAELIGRLQYEGFHFVSLVPLTYAVRTELVEHVRVEGDELPELARAPGPRKADPDRVYRGASFRRPMAVVHPTTGDKDEREMTLLVVHSDSQELGFDNAFEKRLVKEERRFHTAVKKANKRKFRCREDAEAARDEVLRILELQSCDLQVVEVEIVEKRSKPGRPKKGETPPVRTEYRLEYEELDPDEEGVARARFHASHYVLVTDRDDWDDARILDEYRQQSMIEGSSGFRWLKNVAHVAPVFLKTPHRIAALGLVFMLALMVRNYLQFELRSGLKDTDETVRGRKPRVRTQSPTTETAFLNFMGLSSVLVFLGERFIQRKVERLTPDASTVLAILGVLPVTLNPAIAVTSSVARERPPQPDSA